VKEKAKGAINEDQLNVAAVPNNVVFSIEYLKKSLFDLSVGHILLTYQ
jgi:hypothetical protein